MDTRELRERFGNMVLEDNPRPRHQQQRGRNDGAARHPIHRDPSIHRAPSANPHPLQRAPSLPRPPTSHQAVYFREGTGYLFIKTLGNGVDGSATLVRSVANGKTYVRKEEFFWNDIPSNKPDFLRTPPEETANALQVRGINGTYRAHGWTRWVDSQAPICFNVTYWRHYDLGALENMIKVSMETRILIPDVWGALWFVSMLDTLVQVQKAGIVHNDPHRGNWLLESTESGIPRIILGDFGRSERKVYMSKSRFKEQCTEDFELVLNTICSVLNLIHSKRDRAVYQPEGSTVSPKLVAKLSTFAVISTMKWGDLKELHKAVLDASEGIFRVCPGAEGLRHPGAVPKPITSAFKTGEGLIDAVREKPQGFKQWRMAKVTGSEIETRSTAYCGKFVAQAGEWYERMGESHPVWHVDRA